MKRPSPDPTRQGFLFDGWFIGEIAYDFSKPVTQNLTLTAKWTPKSRNNTWSISPSQGSQLGGNSTTITPPNTSRGIRFSQVSGSKNDDFSPGFSLAVGSDGNAYAWGDNKYGELGDGKPDNGMTNWRTTPVMVEKPSDAPADFTYVQVSAGSRHSLALSSDGNAYAWGWNPYGQLGDGTTTPRITPGRVSKPANTPPDFTYVQVSTGQYHSLALGSDGNAYAWGSNYYGQLGDGTTTKQNTPVRVRIPVGAPTDFAYVQVSAGGNHSLAVGSDGYAYAWGWNGNDGQLGNNTSDNNVNPVPVRVRDPNSPTDENKGLKAVQVSSGRYHSLALGSDGNAYAWGWNPYGQLGNNTSDTSETKVNPVPVRVRDPNSPTDENKSLKAVQVSAGWEHSLALGSDGNAYAWGWNSGRQLGSGTATSSKVPLPVMFPLPLVITGVKFDRTLVSGLKPGDGSSVTMITPAHLPGTVTVKVTYKLGVVSHDTQLRYKYTLVEVLPRAGGEGILLILATSMTGMGGVLASRRHRRETYQLLQASHE